MNERLALPAGVLDSQAAGGPAGTAGHRADWRPVSPGAHTEALGTQPPPAAAGGTMAVFRHVMTGTTPGEQWSCTLYTTGSGTLAAAQATWHTAVGDFWTGHLDGIVTADVVVTEVSTASIDPATGKQESRLMDDVNLPGVDAGEMLPFQCATSISWRTALATRAGRGRIYLPPLGASVLATGRLSSAAQGVIATAAAQLVGALDTGGLQLILFGRETHTQTPVTGGDVGDVIDTQRRRRNKLIEARTPVTFP